MFIELNSFETIYIACHVAAIMILIILTATAGEDDDEDY